MGGADSDDRVAGWRAGHILKNLSVEIESDFSNFLKKN